MEERRSITIQDVLEHEDWIRALARKMLREDSLVDDVVQDTFLAALKAPATEIKNRTAWLTRVVGNLVRARLRDAGRQGSLLRSPDLEPPRAASPAEIQEYESLRQAMVELVFSLEEPYRETVLLRTYQGLSLREIAEQTGVPRDTVRTHWRRALDRLRERSKEEELHGVPLWTLLPFLVDYRSPSALSAALGGKAALGGLAVLLVAGAGWMLTRDGREQEELSAAAPVEREDDSARRPEPQLDPSELELTPGGEAAREPLREEAVVAQGPTLSGTVIQRFGASLPVAGVDLEVEIHPGLRLVDDPVVESISSGADGSFRLALEELEPALLIVRVADRRWHGTTAETVAEAGLDARHEIQLTVIPFDCDLDLHVVDAAGDPLQARIFALDREVITSFEGRRRVRWSSEGASIVVVADGYAVTPVDIEAVEPGDVRPATVVLDDYAPHVELQVFDRDGPPLPDSAVTYRGVSFQAGEGGWVELLSIAMDTRVLVSSPGFVSERYTLTNQALQEVRLTRAVPVEGRVLDETGVPVAAARVVVGQNLHDPESVETYTGQDGVFALDRVPEGWQSVWSRHPRHAPHAESVDVLRRREGDVLQDIHLPPERKLKAVVVDPDGAPVRGALIYVLYHPPPPVGGIWGLDPTARSDSSGEFDLRGLPGVNAQLVVSHPDFEELIKDLPALLDQGGTVDLPLKRER
ncbi:MAG: sigma-70 family RNA polymerase sigma factor [Planctomycetota bacterium]